jgi:hypothetical protein
LIGDHDLHPKMTVDLMLIKDVLRSGQMIAINPRADHLTQKLTVRQDLGQKDQVIHTNPRDANALALTGHINRKAEAEVHPALVTAVRPGLQGPPVVEVTHPEVAVALHPVVVLVPQGDPAVGRVLANK